MDAEGLGRKLLLTPSGDPRRPPEKQTKGTVTASHKMLTLQALSSSLNAGTAKGGWLGKRCPPAVCPPEWPHPFTHYRFYSLLTEIYWNLSWHWCNYFVHTVLESIAKDDIRTSNLRLTFFFFCSAASRTPTMSTRQKHALAEYDPLRVHSTPRTRETPKNSKSLERD